MASRHENSSVRPLFLAHRISILETILDIYTLLSTVSSVTPSANTIYSHKVGAYLDDVVGLLSSSPIWRPWQVFAR